MYVYLYVHMFISMCLHIISICLIFISISTGDGNSLSFRPSIIIAINTCNEISVVIKTSHPCHFNFILNPIPSTTRILYCIPTPSVLQRTIGPMTKRPWIKVYFPQVRTRNKMATFRPSALNESHEQAALCRHRTTYL